MDQVYLKSQSKHQKGGNNDINQKNKYKVVPQVKLQHKQDENDEQKSILKTYVEDNDDFSRSRLFCQNQDQNDISGIFSAANVSQTYRQDNDNINKLRVNDTHESEEEKRSDSGFEQLESKNSQRTINQNLQQKQQDQNKKMVFQRKSTLGSRDKRSMTQQKSGDYCIENGGVVKRRLLFEIGIASDERQELQKFGLDEELENDVMFTFEDDISETKRKKNMYIDSTNGNFNTISDRYNEDEILEQRKRNSSRSLTEIISQSSKGTKSQKVAQRMRSSIENSPSTQVRKKTSGDDFDSTPCRSSQRSHTYNRNSPFEQEKVEEYSQRRRSKFLMNQRIRLSLLQVQDQLSPCKQDRSPSGQFNKLFPLDELKINNNGNDFEPATPQPIFNINDNGLTGADLQWRFVGIMRRVKKFSKCLMDHIYFRDFSNINSLHIKAIGDLSYFILSEFNVNLKNFKKKLRVIEPSDTLALIWNFFLMFSIIVCVFTIPLKTSFSLVFVDYSFENIGLQKFPSLILFMDIFVNFFLAYYEKGVLISEISQIWSSYFRFGFFFNVLTTMSIIINFDHSLIQWIFMLRIFQIPKLLGMIDEHFQIQQRFNTIYELTKLIILIVSMAHFVGCGFHFIAQYDISQGSQNTWLDFYNYTDDEVQFRYLHSIYFAFITMITVGYGDITPKSPREKLYVIVITVISCGLFGYSMNTIGKFIIHILFQIKMKYFNYILKYLQFKLIEFFLT